MTINNLVAPCVGNFGQEESFVESPTKEDVGDLQDIDAEGIGVEFNLHNPMTKWSLVMPI